MWYVKTFHMVIAGLIIHFRIEMYISIVDVPKQYFVYISRLLNCFCNHNWSNKFLISYNRRFSKTSNIESEKNLFHCFF